MLCNYKAADKHTPGLDKLNVGTDHMKCKWIKFRVAQKMQTVTPLRSVQYKWLGSQFIVYIAQLILAVKSDF